MSGDEGGGGGCFYGGGSIIISNCYASNNTALGRAGGFWINSATIKNCVIARNNVLTNSSNHGGGGVYMSGDTSMLRDSTLEGNICNVYAGGVYFEGGNIINCLIINNVAVNGGGMRRRLGSNKLISSCTIVSNYATSAGGGIHDARPDSTSNFENCIIYLNKSGALPVYSNYYIAAGVKTSYTNCCISPELAGDAVTYSVNNITSNPQFVSSEAGDYRLGNGSPSINAGATREWMNTAYDLDGHRRVDQFSGIADIGCYESVPKGTLYKGQ
jgi:hypothetical protein